MADRSSRSTRDESATRRRHALLFGRTVRELRLARGDLSLRELARRIGKSATYVSAIERGIVPPPTELVIAEIAAALHSDPNQLLALAGRIPRKVTDSLLLIPELFPLIAELKPQESEIDQLSSDLTPDGSAARYILKRWLEWALAQYADEPSQPAGHPRTSARSRARPHPKPGSRARAARRRHPGKSESLDMGTSEQEP